MNPTRTFRLLAVILALFFTVGCDQATKHLARAKLGQNSTGSFSDRILILEFTLAENSGAFLSLGATLPPSARTGLVGVAAVALGALLVYLVRAYRLRWLVFFGLLLVWTGGTSNLIDRFVRHGLVTDFMLLRLGPLHTGIFNVADAVIVTGSLLVLSMLCFPQHHIDAKEKARWRARRAGAAGERAREAGDVKRRRTLNLEP